MSDQSAQVPVASVPPELPTSPPISTSRVIATVTPLASLVAGSFAAWLFNHFPGLSTVIQQDTATSNIASGIVWVVGALITYAIANKWLDGLSKWERTVIEGTFREISAKAVSTARKS